MLLCLLSWRYTYKDNRSQYVLAGLPIKKEFEKLPEIGELLTFTPVLTALYGAGESVKQGQVKAKVRSIEPANCKAFDYSIIFDIEYDIFKEADIPKEEQYVTTSNI